MISSLIKQMGSIESLKQKYTGKTIVIKFGGSVAANLDSVRNIAQQIEFLQITIGAKVIVVHGGKEQIDASLIAAGHTNIQWHNETQERVTTADMMPVIDNALRDLNGLLGFHMERATQLVTFHNIAGYEEEVVFAQATQDLTGKVINVDTTFFHGLDPHIVPIFYSVAKNNAGQRLNINADDMAAAIAKALKAHSLFLLSDCSGVLDNEHNIIEELSELYAQELINNGTILNGMIPKIKGAFQAAHALPKGRVVIMNGHEYDGIIATVSGISNGTIIRPNL